MKKFLKISLVCLIIIIAYFIISYFFKIPISSFFKKNTVYDSIPSNFLECDERNPKQGNFNPSDYLFPFCNYFAEEGSPQYQECLSIGGLRTEKVWLLCPGCGCIPAGCTLTYIDPNFELPSNYYECRKVFTHSGGRDASENNGKEQCSILIPSEGVYNKDTGEKLYKECFNRGGKPFGDSGNCELKFYED